MEPSGAYYSARAVKEAANGRWVDILGRLGIDTSLLVNRHGPCPGCGGKDRFRFDDDGGNGSFICSQGGGGLLAGDGFELVKHCKGWDWKQAIVEIGGMLGVRPERGRECGIRNADCGLGAGVAAEPVGERLKVSKIPIDKEKVWEYTQGSAQVNEQWLARRSLIDVESCDSVSFLRYLYLEGERVLIFTNEHSQGEFLYWKREGELGEQRSEVGGRRSANETFRLSQQRNVKAVASALPEGGAKGVWFLTNPVTGKWEINPRAKGRDGSDQPSWSRRSAEVITAWKYYVLESDELSAEDWLKVLVNLPLPIAAIYTSGKRSIHALVHFPVPTKAHWDAVRDQLRAMVCPLGADPGAMSAVRLSRLPGCVRGSDGRQRLLFLNPGIEASTPIVLLKEMR